MRRTFAAATRRSTEPIVAGRRHGSGPALAGTLAAAALLAAGCGGSSSTSSSSSSPAASSAPAAATTPPAATTAAATTPAASTQGLSGTWNGSYSGSYSGTFVLNWTQAGSHLVGSIQLSAPPGTLPIHGTLSGSTISFGTVGSLAITYKGSVSGSSMSGTYQTPAGGGSWNASKK